MSKAVLVLEDMPERCVDCPVCDITGQTCPAGNFDDISDMDSKPDWCPLVSLPERQKPLNKKGYRSGYIEGWNDAIDAIEREA